jgi:hypothetical protein
MIHTKLNEGNSAEDSQATILFPYYHKFKLIII